MPYKKRATRMPRRAKRKPRPPRRRYRKQGQLTGNYVSKPLGNYRKVVTRYVENQISINPGAAGIADNYIFSANGLYDPNITGVGHQPIGFDQFMLMYDHYTVIGSKIKCTFINTDGSTPAQVGISLKDNVAAETDIRRNIENALCKYKTIGATGSGDSNKAIITMTFSTRKFFRKKSIIAESDYKGTSSANPTEQAYFHCWGAPIASVDPTSIQLFVEIEYIAILTEPKLLTLS